MNSSIVQLIEKLQRGAVERCRERVLRSTEKPNASTKNVEPNSSNWDSTTHLKRRHGL
ncbi:MAG TPA: hypothetical protein VEG44_10030 [Candidatus Acidoferrales bacterium]|nr:hypothetical protein [Candidatus Acidoferrales bacterium]